MKVEKVRATEQQQIAKPVEDTSTNNTEEMLDQDVFVYRRGTKYYKIQDGKVSIIRIINVKNMNKFICMNDEDYNGDPNHGEKFSLTKDQIMNEYRLLLPNSQLCLVLVTAENGVPDVLIALNQIDVNTAAVSYTASSVVFGDVEIICRQNIIDFFALIANPKGVKSAYGISISRKTCPANIKFDMMYKNCVPTDKAQFINLYQQDGIDQILGILRTTKADMLLRSIYDQASAALPEGSTMGVDLVGVEKTLKELVISNGLIYDFRQMFNIISMPNVTIKYCDNILVLDEDDERKVEYAIKCRMTDIKIVELNHFVSESDLPEGYAYAKICDSTGKLYLIQYSQEPGFAEELYPEEVRNGMVGLLNKFKK